MGGLRLDSILALRVVAVSADLARRLLARLESGQPATDGARLLGAEINRDVLLAGVVLHKGGVWRSGAGAAVHGRE